MFDIRILPFYLDNALNLSKVYYNSERIDQNYKKSIISYQKTTNQRFSITQCNLRNLVIKMKPTEDEARKEVAHRLNVIENLEIRN